MPVIELEAYVPPTAVARKDSTGAKIHLRERDGDILCGAGKKLIADVWEEVASPPVDDPSWCKRCRAAESSIPRLKRVAGASGTALRERAEHDKASLSPVTDQVVAGDEVEWGIISTHWWTVVAVDGDRLWLSRFNDHLQEREDRVEAIDFRLVGHRKAQP